MIAFLSDAKTVFAGVVAGLILGISAPSVAAMLRPLANTYVALLSMCLLPILVSALIGGVAQVVRRPSTRARLPRLALLYFAGLFLPAIVAVSVTLALDPGGRLGEAATALLGRGLAAHSGSGSSRAAMSFFSEIIPKDIFQALDASRFVSIVLFCSLTGAALGAVRSEGSETALGVVNAFYEAFTLLFRWVLIPLPIGLLVLIASSVSQVQMAVLAALLWLVGTIWLSAAVLLILYFAAMALAQRRSIFGIASDLKEPMGLAFVTDNPLVALYASIETLTEKFHTKREFAEAVAPFGVLANQHGQIVLLTGVSLFLAQLYGTALTPTTLGMLGLATVLSGAAAVGGGPTLVPILAPILAILGAPDALAVVVLSTTQAIVAPVCSVVTVGATCALASLAGRESGGEGNTE